MKIAPFEIRIGLIGYVSVGKTTVLNALLKDTFSEVSMKRTTAGVNYFRVTTTKQRDDQAAGWTHEEHCTAESTLAEITTDNVDLRDSNVVHEKTFAIELTEPLFEMRKDTDLVLVDVPGINEAGTSQKYKDFVASNWHTFDCVVIVLDGRQGVNTEEQVALLQFTSHHCQKERNVPVIVLMNKIDDPAEQEQQVLVEEATLAVERIFGTPNRSNALATVLSGAAANGKVDSPFVIPMSAINGFILRSASALSFEMFQAKMDAALVDKLGREAYGYRWNRFSPETKFEKAFQVIQDKEQYEDGFEESNFGAFLAVLSFCVGGIANQASLIEKHIELAAGRLTPDEDYVAKLKTMHDKCARLGKPADFIGSAFLELHQLSTNAAFASCHGSMGVKKLAKPMNELYSFCELSNAMGNLELPQKHELLGLARTMVLRQIEMVLVEWQNRPRLTSSDWILISGAMLGLARERFFDQHFGMARILLEKKFQESCCESWSGGTTTHGDGAKKDNNNNNTSSDAWQFHLVDGTFVPTVKFRKNIHVDVVDSVSDPRHFGHLIWQFDRLNTILHGST